MTTRRFGHRDYPQARLPSEFIEHTVGDLEVGESAYVVPWAMSLDADGLLWLDPRTGTDAEPGGTVQMQITRTAQGYVADIRSCAGHKWNISQVEDRYIPVRELLK